MLTDQRRVLTLGKIQVSQLHVVLRLEATFQEIQWAAVCRESHILFLVTGVYTQIQR